MGINGYSLILKVGMNHNVKFELHTQKENCHMSLITVNILTSSPMNMVWWIIQCLYATSHQMIKMALMNNAKFQLYLGLNVNTSALHY
jgi:hypothetical protein